MCVEFNISCVARATLEVIGKFTVLWHQFEKHFFNNNFTPNFFKLNPRGGALNKEKESIFTQIGKFYVSDSILLAFYNVVIERHIQQLEESYAHPTNARIDKRVKKAIKDFTDNKNITLFNAICVIYRIRCNLCHGLKEINDLNNQQKLFEAINNIFLGMFKKE